jgi:hypothetical protein
LHQSNELKQETISLNHDQYLIRYSFDTGNNKFYFYVSFSGTKDGNEDDMIYCYSIDTEGFYEIIEQLENDIGFLRDLIDSDWTYYDYLNYFSNIYGTEHRGVNIGELGNMENTRISIMSSPEKRELLAEVS